jgi:hypothetical protein
MNGDEKNSYGILEGKLEGKRPQRLLGSPRYYVGG